MAVLPSTNRLQHLHLAIEPIPGVMTAIGACMRFGDRIDLNAVAVKAEHVVAPARGGLFNGRATPVASSDQFVKRPCESTNEFALWAAVDMHVKFDNRG
jgi:hypothetical protein